MKRLSLICLCLLLCAPALAEDAALYLAVGGEIERHPFAFEGEKPSAGELLDGLGALTGYNFSTEDIIREGDELFITWADEASFLPGGEIPDGIEFAALLQRMLDSAWTTLRENLGVRDIYFGTTQEAGLYFESIHWLLDADDPYSGDFDSHYMDGDTPLGCAATWMQACEGAEGG